ncbi:hypothetical protein CP532_2599 [Ophiocordyceps camponoti-leonardi (nom. inval.)]|nr:hypothetical protein CP532_2599 [Ophiocordyceps camponoti-leonardi (nom. inval.)]
MSSSGTILITGANGSLALPAVSHLLQHSPTQKLLLTVRNASADDPNTTELRRIVKEQARDPEDVVIRQLDHACLRDVVDFAAEVDADVVSGKIPPLTSVVCNAYYWNLTGAMEMTDDGFEKTMQVSHLAHVVLILRLLRRFRTSSPARIVLLSSAVHKAGQAVPFEKIPPSIPDEIDLLVRPGADGDEDRAAHGFHRYANAKLVITAWGLALIRRLQKDPTLKHISVVIVNPGTLSDSRALLVNTPRTISLISRFLLRPMQPLLRRVMDPTIRTSAEAAVDIARLATSEAVPDQQGYFTMLQKDESSEESREEAKQEAVWEASEREPRKTMAQNLTADIASLLPPPTTINDSHKVYGVAVACAVMSGFATSVVLWRLYLRYTSRAFGLDDWATIPALVLYLGWSVLTVYVNLAGGIGKPLWEITLDEYAIWFKGFVASSWMYTTMTAAIRIAILLFYHRIFAQAITWLRVTIHALLALQAIYVIVYSILPALACHPFDSAWNPFERRLHCSDWYFYYSQVALYSTSMVFDLVLLILPLEPARKLQMRRSKKAGVVVMFVLGAGASVVTAVKLGIFVNDMNGYSEFDPYCKSLAFQAINQVLELTGSVPVARYQLVYFLPAQLSHNGLTFWLPSHLEPTVALIGASLPGLRPALNIVGANVSQRLRSLYPSRGTSKGVATGAGGTWGEREFDGDTDSSWGRDRGGGFGITRVIETKISSESVNGSEVQLGQYPAPQPTQ